MEHLFAAGLIDPSVANAELIAQVVRAVRGHLRMPFAFVSEFVDQERVFRYVDSDIDPSPLRPGDSAPLTDSYCVRVVDGRLPPVIPDASELPAARELQVTAAFPIGAHISVPIELADGQVFGTFCCFSDRPDHSLNSRDLELMATFSRVIARQIELQSNATRHTSEKRERVVGVIERDELTVFFQPIRSLVDMRLIGLEALSRFPGGAQRSPYLWFSDAQEVGLGVELEILAIKKALHALSVVDEPYLAVNASPAAIMSGRLDELLRDIPCHRLVLEITEHALVADYTALNQALAPLRRQSVRIAIDDAGSGYSTMSHIVALRPDLIKLDAQLTLNLEHDDIKRALVKAMVTFANDIRCDLIAEGIEMEGQKSMLTKLGVLKGQGYLLGRPSRLIETVPGVLGQVGYL